MKGEGNRAYRMTARAEAARETADRIVEVAEALLFEAYYEDVKLSEVAERAEVTVQTILRKFGSKEGLADAVADRVREKIEARLDEAGPGDPAAVLRRNLDRYEEMGDANFRLAAQEERHPAIHSICEQARGWQRRKIEALFADRLPARGTAARERRLLQLLLVYDLYAWKLLRREQGATKNQTRKALQELLEAVLGLDEE